MKTRLTVTLLTLAGLIILAGQLRGGSSAATVDNHVNPHYKGGSAFNLAGAGPNVPRCGAFPQNVELSFTGTGGHAGATCTGLFHIASNLTPCNGQTPPAQVWFEGVIKTAQ